ncbi:hypothetical protein QR680_008372 [Steinernema hermaphroditum]|uniref:Saposin B-type domain-containing protein n=1 Tax=Steinernema hermaphroditum TaxID=289476 RepID=A0AA39M7X5_9BILA|nr:hypothetical protein QR680_008372 [Steinernema hermaphroditum]
MWLANLAWMALLITSAAYLQQADAQKVEQLFFTLLQESSKTSSDLTEPRRLCDEEFFDTLAIVCDHCVLFGRTKGEIKILTVFRLTKLPGVSKKNEMYKRLKLCGAELFQSEVIKSTCPNGFVLDKHDILVDKSSAMSKQFQSCCQTGCSIARINYLFCK